MKKKIWILLILIITFSFTLRVYKLDQIPPSINWDEAANGYNGWTIANYGKDEWGKTFPHYFISFRDDKHPVHIYITAVFVKLFGLSDFVVRLPSAVFGTLNVLLLFLLTKLFLKHNWISLIAAFLLAISPYSIQFSRYNHEANFALFFYLLGLTLFFLGFEKRNIFLSFSFLSFGVGLITYHSSKIVIPITIIVLLCLYLRQILQLKKFFFLGLLFFSFFISLILLSEPLQGISRAAQIAIEEDKIKAKVEIVFNQYLSHFQPQYLFLSGDKNPRHSSQAVGQFYKIDSIFLTLGTIFLISQIIRGQNGFWKRAKVPILILTITLLAPIPASLVRDAPHAGRSLFMMGSWHMVAAYGIYKILEILKVKYIKILVLLGIFLIYSLSLKDYLMFYFLEYPKKYAIEWQYGMKQIVEYTKKHPEYSQIYMTDVHAQPYIFFLFYLKTPLSQLLSNVNYAITDEDKTYNTVSSFGKYNFGGWKLLESEPTSDALYVVTPSQYDNLRHKSLFDIKEIIYYPNDKTAFYLISI